MDGTVFLPRRGILDICIYEILLCELIHSIFSLINNIFQDRGTSVTDNNVRREKIINRFNHELIDSVFH